MSPRKHRCFCLGLIVALFMIGCSPQPQLTVPRPEAEKVILKSSERPKGGRLTAAATSDAVSFHVYKTTDTASSTYQGYVYASGLTKRDPKTLDIVPDMAKGWTVSDDKVTYTFTLRDDLKWSDGQPITSADLLWTFEQAQKPENNYPYRSNFEPIISYQAPDPKTVVVKIKEPLVVGLELTDAVVPLPKHIWEKLDWNDPEKNREIMKPSVVSGMWKLREWKKDDYATFVAHDLYYDGRPNLDTLTVRIVPNQAVAFQMLRSGEVDWAGFTPADYKEAKALKNITVYEWWLAATVWQYIGFNLRRPALQDARVRHALSYAVNRQVLIDRVQYGLAKPTYSGFPPSSWVYNPNVPRYDYDPKKAEELLEQARWRKGPDGIRVKGGAKLQLRLLYGPVTSRVREGIATVVQQQFRDLGVAVEITGLEWGAFLDTIKKPPYDWDLVVLGWRATIDPHWTYQIWAEKTIPDLNAGAYVNKQVEELFEQGAKEFDREKRKKIYQEIQRFLSEDAPYIFLSYDMSYAGINNRIGGIEPSPIGILYDMNQWYAKTAK